MIIINLILLVIIIFLRSIFFSGLSINPTIGTLIILLGVFITVVLWARFILFCLSRKIPLKKLFFETILVLTKKEDGRQHLKRFYEIGIITVISSAILNRESTPFWVYFLLDILVFTGFLIYLYTLQYLIINLQAKLMRMYPK